MKKHNKPRVAILHYAAPPIVGGVETTIGAHARLLAANDYAVKLIAGRGKSFNRRIPLEIIPDVDSKSPRVLAVNDELVCGIVSDRFKTLEPRLTFELQRALSKWDVLIVHNALSLHKNLALTSALKNLNDARRIRLIAWCHDFAWGDPQYVSEIHAGPPWDLLKQAWEGVQYVVVSESRKQELEELWGNPASIAVVPAGIDAGEFFGVTKKTIKWIEALGWLDAEPLLLLPARITRRKKIERAIEIVGALSKLGMHPKLVVTGPPGPHNPTNADYLDQLSVLRKALDLEKSVSFLYEFGNVGDAEMRDLYLLADALLFPSEREGFGIPVLEAGLTRLPIFCADLPPFRETAREHAHYFSPDESPAAIAERMANYFKSDSRFQLKRRTILNYSWQNIFTQKIEPLLRI